MLCVSAPHSSILNTPTFRDFSTLLQRCKNGIWITAETSNVSLHSRQRGAISSQSNNRTEYSPLPHQAHNVRRTDLYGDWGIHRGTNRCYFLNSRVWCLWRIRWEEFNSRWPLHIRRTFGVDWQLDCELPHHSRHRHQPRVPRSHHQLDTPWTWFGFIKHELQVASKTFGQCIVQRSFTGRWSDHIVKLTIELAGIQSL